MAAPKFNVFNLSAYGTGIGALSAPIPCVPGDDFAFTATIRYVSGPMQPLIQVAFMDAALSTTFGTLPVGAVMTDNGWHIGTVFGKVPAGAQVAVVQTYCE